MHGIQNQRYFPHYDIEKQDTLEQKKCQYMICNFWVAISVFGVIALIGVCIHILWIWVTEDYGIK